jgi:hypothetical protein
VPFLAPQPDLKIENYSNIDAIKQLRDKGKDKEKDFDHDR